MQRGGEGARLEDVRDFAGVGSRRTRGGSHTEVLRVDGNRKTSRRGIATSRRTRAGAASIIAVTPLQLRDDVVADADLAGLRARPRRC